MDEVIGILIGIAAILAFPILTIVSLVRANTARQDIAALKLDLASLRQKLGIPAETNLYPTVVDSNYMPVQPSGVPVDKVPASPPPPKTSPQMAIPSYSSPQLAEDSSASEPKQSPLYSEISLPPNQNPQEQAEIRNFGFAQNWLIWAGGATVAIAGVFLVKYGIEYGLLGPSQRIVAGLLFGLALIASAEWLYRRDTKSETLTVAQALAGAGLATLFAVLYGAHTLYGLIDPQTSAILLAAVGFSGITLALRFGAFIAVLGLAGNYVMPLLLLTPDPSIALHFFYLTVVNGAGLALLLRRPWHWLGWVVLIGGFGWSLLWISMDSAVIADRIVVSAYVLGLGAMFWAVGALVPRTRWSIVSPFSFADLPMLEVVTVIALIVAGLQSVGLAHLGHYDELSLVHLGLFAALGLAVAASRPNFELLAPITGIIIAVAIVYWPLPFFTPAPTDLARAVGSADTFDPFYRFLIALGAFAVGFAGASLAMLRRSTWPYLWAMLGGGSPVVLAALGYWRVADFAPNAGWATAELLAAALAVLGAQQSACYRGQRGAEAALATYAVAAVAGLAAALVMVLREAWLTVALSAMLPAIAEINRRVTVRGLRPLAFLIAAVVAIRLLANPYVLEYKQSNSAAMQLWLFYGYGLPMVFCQIAARMFRRDRNDSLVALLEAISLAFLACLLSFSIRIQIAGSLTASSFDLIERSLHGLIFLAMGYGLLSVHRYEPRMITLWGGRVLVALGSLFVGINIVFNPLWSGESVGDRLIVDLLLLAYGAPALIYSALRYEFAKRQEHLPMTISGAAALFLSFAYLTLEIRHAFQGPQLDGAYPSNAEMYAYSAGWLLYAGVLLALGFLARRLDLLRLGLGALLIVSLKVFLIDMSALEGLYRVASFLGLGFTLMGVGWLIKRDGIKAHEPSSAPQSET